MTNSAQSTRRTPSARINSGVIWLVAGSVAACSLLAPNDEYYSGGASASGAGGGLGGQGGQADSEGGQADGDAGSGGLGGLGGAAGHSDPEAGGASGGETSIICNGDAADCNHQPSDGCEVDLSSSAANCGGCGEAFACAEDEICEHRECISRTGCSDGTREGFLPASNWPTIAGCTAKWPRSSLRAPKTGGVCGYEREVCAVPADACGRGWHVCAIPPFGPAEVRERATAEECAAQPGAFVAAVGDQFCEPCSKEGAGAACCGERCVQQNGNCIYPGMTAWFGMINNYVNLCGAIESDLVQHGVLCCRAP